MELSGLPQVLVLLFQCVMNILFVHELQSINKKTKIPRVTDEGWNIQKQLSGPVKEKRGRRNLLYPHPKLSLGLVYCLVDRYIGDVILLGLVDRLLVM